MHKHILTIAPYPEGDGEDAYCEICGVDMHDTLKEIKCIVCGGGPSNMGFIDKQEWAVCPHCNDKFSGEPGQFALLQLIDPCHCGDRNN